jgi:hypothetical protein
MPWGKHKGVDIADVPLSYLAWVLEECDNVAWQLRDAIRRELADRLGLQPAQRYQPPATVLDRGRLADALAAWHRRACLQHHPDRGGDERVMMALNDARDELAVLITPR